MSQKNKNQKNLHEWRTDHRTAGDIEEQIRSLASSYVPEWHFDTERPDIGAAIGKVFAGQMEENIGRCGQVLSNYHTEFVNMLGISLLPARPAMATVLFQLVQNTIPGVEIYKGTKLLADGGEDGDQVVFETLHNLYVTGAELSCAFMTDQDSGKVMAVKGSFPRARGLEEKSPEDEEEPEEEPGLRPFRLFSDREPAMNQDALLLYHSSAFDVEEEPIRIHFERGKALVEQIRKGELKFWYQAEDGIRQVEDCQVEEDGETVVLRKKEPCKKTEEDGLHFSALALKAESSVKENLTVFGITAASSGMAVPAQAVNSGVTDLEPEDFEPFGDTLSLFQECYIGHDGYFSKAGARITLEFDASYEEHRMLTTAQEEDEGLKIIKRKPRRSTIETADAWAEEISVEYYNGVGWKKLPFDTEVRRLFAEGQAGHYELEFLCPEDWAEIGAGAYQGRCLRIQLLKSDNCYVRPGVHHYPRIRGLRVAFSYEGREMEPEKLIRISGDKRVDLTKKLKEGAAFTAFSASGYTEDALYLGFSRKLETGPISILFQMQDGVHFEDSRVRFEYASPNGFKQMKVLDYTADMSRSGTVMFLPPADLTEAEFEGRRAYWLRICRSGGEKHPYLSLPMIQDICLNAVQAANIETREEEEFYLDEVYPGLTVSLGVADILDVELWVNERGSLSEYQMRQMLEQQLQSVRAEYDAMGNISSFYVLWQETDQFHDPPSRRVYVLDRMNSALVFGDGVETDLPKVLDDVSFRIQIRCCLGSAGNVGAGQIGSMMGNIMFVDQIMNPIAAYGGSNMESIDSALTRGANILRSRRRLVSEEDYIQEILSFSDAIDQVRCVPEENGLYFVLLLKDFESGSYSFHNISGALKNHLLENCELTVAPDEMVITEPVFVRISVDVWTEIFQMDDSFEVQGRLQEILEEYLNPVGEDGWEIGVLPKRNQILMRLNELKGKALIKKLVVTAHYTDESGSHETDLEELKQTPYMVCASGSHHVHMIQTEWNQERRNPYA